ncbi:hypothetical protein BT63DRAFT_425070 [Microthyrium microscopicum]|uniref:Uncharacterized protein n=1 Tax=Microthyrium microscopicum TaxID=703497 RepID=A0A6A6UAX7_9PEZI|nr:hypothetical protein BT63DRAFT_425070 [Microthyrium microscopicum]
MGSPWLKRNAAKTDHWWPRTGRPALALAPRISPSALLCLSQLGFLRNLDLNEFGLKSGGQRGCFISHRSSPIFSTHGEIMVPDYKKPHQSKKLQD